MVALKQDPMSEKSLLWVNQPASTKSLYVRKPFSDEGDSETQRGDLLPDIAQSNAYVILTT